MNHSFEKLIKKAGKHEALSPEEREKMRFVLQEYRAFKPLPKAPASDTTVEVFGLWISYLRRPMALAAAVLLIVVVSGGGVAFAAENTLPGDTLYPIKVSVTEPARTLLASTPAAKADWQMTLAERRISEATTLASEGRLSTTTEVALTTNFETHVTAAKTAAEEEDQSDPGKSVVASAAFTARLGAYESVLTEVTKTNEKDVATPLRDAIHGQIALLDQDSSPHPAAAMMFSANAKVAPASSSSSENVHGFQTASDQALKNSADLIGSASTSLSSENATQAREELETAERLNTEGQDRLKADDTEGASAAFRASLSTSARLEVLTHAAATFNINAFALSGGSATTSVKNMASTTATSSPSRTHIYATSPTKGNDASATGTTGSTNLPTLPTIHLAP